MFEAFVFSPVIGVGIANVKVQIVSLAKIEHLRFEFDDIHSIINVDYSFTERIDRVVIGEEWRLDDSMGGCVGENVRLRVQLASSFCAKIVCNE